MRPALMAALALLVAFVIGIVLFALDRTLLGIVAVFAGIPVALTAWVVSNDR